ncbi:hypothetical protein NUU61_006661 [Penicillium alfredii]|uniref:Rhodopsin domain-containing protein n=1 Tax=Penicillium alfredii TaxID=1506179 RepID=A0A9W9F1G2_9EURO|nr:uncharacterized protein NUU61_006661 [Penicillium alfredii]KAJ5091791.1 hypothetical protein NUU61_006661 [Penicillium alfredii]
MILTATGGPIPATIWSVVEAHTGIICTCLPVFRYPLQFLFPKLFHSQQNSTPYGYSFNRNTPRRTPLATSSERNLNDTNDDAWHGKARGFSEDLPKDALEMMPTRNGNLSPAGNITKVTDVQISYDQRSDASSCPIRSREF